MEYENKDNNFSEKIIDNENKNKNKNSHKLIEYNNHDNIKLNNDKTNNKIRHSNNNLNNNKTFIFDKKKEIKDKSKQISSKLEIQPNNILNVTPIIHDNSNQVSNNNLYNVEYIDNSEIHRSSVKLSIYDFFLNSNNINISNNDKNYLQKPVKNKFRTSNNYSLINYSEQHYKINKLNMFLLIFLSSCGTFFMGYNEAVFDTLEHEFIQMFNYDTSETNIHIVMISTAITAGAIIGAFASGFITNNLGRKNTFLLLDVISILATILTIFKNVYSIIAGRFIIGFGIGGYTYVSRLYMAEMSPNSLRGQNIAIIEIFYMVGIQVAYLFGFGISISSYWWQIMFGLNIIICGIHLILTLALFNYETPIYSYISVIENIQRISNIVENSNAIDTQTNLFDNIHNFSTLFCDNKTAIPNKSSNDLYDFNQDIRLSLESIKANKKFNKIEDINEAYDKLNSNVNSIKKAKIILNKIYINNEDIENVLNEIKRISKEKIEQLKISYLDLLFLKKKYVKRIYVCLAIVLFCIFVGIDALIYYSEYIFHSYTNKGQLYTNILGCSQLISSVLSVTFVEHLGRKKLLLIGHFIYLLTLVTTAIMFNFNINSSYLFLFIIMICVNAITINPVTNIYLTDVLPEKGIALSYTFYYIFKLILTSTFKLIVTESSFTCLFLIYASITFLGIIFIFIVLKESQGKSLEELDNLY